jgi:hypothetical protein
MFVPLHTYVPLPPEAVKVAPLGVQASVAVKFGLSGVCTTTPVASAISLSHVKVPAIALDSTSAVYSPFTFSLVATLPLPLIPVPLHTYVPLPPLAVKVAPLGVHASVAVKFGLPGVCTTTPVASAISLSQFKVPAIALDSTPAVYSPFTISLVATLPLPLIPVPLHTYVPLPPEAVKVAPLGVHASVAVKFGLSGVSTMVPVMVPDHSL